MADITRKSQCRKTVKYGKGFAVKIRIEEYRKAYKADAQALLNALQEHLVEIDPLDVQIFSKRYRDEYLSFVLEILEECEGKMFLAFDGDRAVGLIAGYIEKKDEEDKLTNSCPKRGVISELVVDEKYRGQGIGKLLMNSVEAYFSSMKCQFYTVGVFGPNADAARFYGSLGYHTRNIEMMKESNSE